MREAVRKKHSGSLGLGVELWLLLAIVVASAVLRIALVHVDRIVRWDEPDYLILGRNLFTGQGYTVCSRPELHYAPLFPIVTGMLYPLTKDMKLNSDICFIIFGTLTLLPFYGLARRLFGLRIGLMSVVFLCFFPALTGAVLFWGTMLEPLYLFLLYAALFAVWIAWETQQLGAYLAAGALFGLAYLTKPEAVVYVGLMFFLLFLASLRRSSFAWRTGLRLLAGIIAFVLVISPYIVFLYRHTGRVMVSGKLGVTYVAGQGAVDRDPSLYDQALSRLDKAGEEIIWFSADRFQYRVWDSIKADLRGFVRRVWRNVNTLERVLFTRQVFPFYFLIILSAGWFGQEWNKERAIKEAFLFAIILPVFIFLPFHIELRYFAPMLPILLLWLAKGIATLADWLQRTWMNLRSITTPSSKIGTGFAVLACALVVLYFLVLQPLVVRDGLAGMNSSRRKAGLWLKANSSPEALIMSRDTEVPFYAERRWAATPHEDYTRFIAYVRKRGANYLVVDEREVTVVRPQLRLLLNKDAPPSGLRHVYTAHDPRGNTIVYEVLY